MASCSSGKRVYQTHELAEEALIGAHINFQFGKGKGPIGVYQCEDCGLFHLTSQGIINQRLAKLINEGEIQKQKEANWWEERSKRK